MLEPGSVVAGKYRIERVIGRGGMGMVVEALHEHLGQRVALKFLHRAVVGNTGLTERFLREARATAALKSEHVCRVFDVGTHEGTPYLVMEKLEGTDLAHVLHDTRRLPIETACHYLIQACAGIGEAHAAQIIHRDLKPGNLFLTTRPDGTALIKVLDFGIAKAPGDRDLELTGTDAILGSPSYMSLEQLRSSKLVDARSDIWSLGVILFEMVAGRRPYVGESVADLALKVAMEPMPKLVEAPHLEPVIARCLALEPAHRYQDVAELAAGLAPFAPATARALVTPLARAVRISYPPEQPSSGPIVAGPSPIVAGRGVATTLAPGESSTVGGVRSRATIAGVIGGAILAGTLLGVIVTRGGKGDDVAAVAPADAAVDAPMARAPSVPIDAAVPVAAKPIDKPIERPIKRPPRTPKKKPKRPAEDFGKDRI